ncbi:hypothetical protein [Tritonibacter scottomollicae]|uniref:Uncharacterized protein n=1 Tax=Tritonibacter scottomollicae TaxID=483013 RepID=A0A2T1A1Y1_TRISK|nr:hypothetical protein [Tritonibacter scottomollicae]PRZ42620.1 hypothetical protein CLV89_1337 [Tritonibacter scottomollicae]
MKLLSKLAVAVAAFWLPAQGFAGAEDTAGILKLEYTDGRPASVGVEDVNTVLRSVGVRVSTVALPKQALPVLEASRSRAVTAEEEAQLISDFALSREDLLAEIAAAGREPTVENGGSLTTSEPGVAPYPKVYDMHKMNADTRVWVHKKFGPLHINHAEDGTGIDEVMTIVSGGPWVWFFELPGDVIGKLTLGHVGPEGEAWRISYPGIRPHGGFLDPEYGLVVAHAHGPEQFEIHFDADNIAGSRLNGTNAWIDISGDKPLLLDAPLTGN